MSPSRALLLCCSALLLCAGASCAGTEGVWAAYPGVGFYPPAPDPLDSVDEVVVVAVPAAAGPGVDTAKSDGLSASWAASLCGILQGSGRRCSVTTAAPATAPAASTALLQLSVTISRRFEQTAPAATHGECGRFERVPVHVNGVFQGHKDGACLEAGEERELPERAVVGREGLALLRVIVEGKSVREQSVRCSPLLAGAPPEFTGELPGELVEGILPARTHAPAEYFLVDPRQPELGLGVAAFASGDLDGAATRFGAASRSTATPIAAAARANLGQLRCWRGEGEVALAELAAALDGLGCGGTAQPPDASACERLRSLRLSGCRARVFAGVTPQQPPSQPPAPGSAPAPLR